MDKKEEKILPDNVSGVRYILNEAHDLKNKFLESFVEAISTENAVVILEGDWGGQIYLV